MRPVQPTERFEIDVHIDNEFAADVRGLQLASLTESDFDVLYNIWLEYSVIRVRQQTLSDADLVRFSQRFGELDPAPPLGSGEAVWHTDMSYIPMPPKASILYALETPSTGGETSFLDMHHAWLQLDTEAREFAQRTQIKHDGTTSSAGTLRPGMAAIDGLDDPLQTPGCLHPAVIRHPETGNACLYLGRRHRAWIPGMDRTEADAHLDKLWEMTIKTARTWTQTWMPGDIVIWDNRAVMHQRNPFDAHARRLMHRTQVRGETAPAAVSPVQ